MVLVGFTPPEVTKNRMDWVFRSLTSSDVAVGGAA